MYKFPLSLTCTDWEHPRGDCMNNKSRSINMYVQPFNFYSISEIFLAFVFYSPIALHVLCCLFRSCGFSPWVAGWAFIIYSVISVRRSLSVDFTCPASGACAVMTVNLVRYKKYLMRRCSYRALECLKHSGYSHYVLLTTIDDLFRVILM